MHELSMTGDGDEEFIGAEEHERRIQRGGGAHNEQLAHAISRVMMLLGLGSIGANGELSGDFSPSDQCPVPMNEGGQTNSNFEWMMMVWLAVVTLVLMAGLVFAIRYGQRWYHELDNLGDQVGGLDSSSGMHRSRLRIDASRLHHLHPQRTGEDWRLCES